MAFQPNKMKFDEGLELLEKAARKAGVNRTKILTSRDSDVRAAIADLQITNIPDGFTKWMIPTFMDGPTQLYFSYAAPNVSVPKHSHDEGDGIRVIIHGKIKYKDKELSAGDWMFVPQGVAYEFKVGPEGVGMFYCYKCCCA
ncbi:cupin domain-containing protein [Rhizobium phaseoli]|uniref:hypothetical protein n=1 Tax=Rhizobium phaseoli TaxID=396 RepID=UPI0007F0B6E6|nr:hypothetical protein [Rhizobium phaseoli]ANL70410.1 cupin domain-containing protein [Rhizobium phaseoli]